MLSIFTDIHATGLRLSVGEQKMKFRNLNMCTLAFSDFMVHHYMEAPFIINCNLIIIFSVEDGTLPISDNSDVHTSSFSLGCKTHVWITATTKG